MSRWSKQEFECPVIGETVRIALRRGGGLFGEPERTYVYCDQRDCQWVDENRPPCPLSVDMFCEEVDDLVETFLRVHAGTPYCHTCLADEVDGVFDRVRKATWRLRVSGQFPILAARCASCSRRRMTIRAITRTPTSAVASPSSTSPPRTSSVRVPDGSLADHQRSLPE